jgi:hypothetical protein
MAEIRLDREEADGYLPNICMCCGEEATVFKTRKMSWCPPWVGVLILVAWPVWLAVTIIMTKRTTIQAPFCDQHKGHWFNRTLLISLTGVALAAIVIPAFIFAITLGDRPGRGNDFAPFVCIGGVVLFVVWLILVIIAQSTAIRPKEITDYEITLQGVSNEFVDAMEERDRARRSRRRQRRDELDDDYDDEEDEDEPPPPRKKAPSSDAIRDEKRRRAEAIEEDEPAPRKKRRPANEEE